MLGSRLRSVKAASAALALSWSVAGCYWRYYPQVMETHLSLLVSYANKIAALAEDGRAVPAERWGEFTYPLERARDFARIAAKRFPDRSSLGAFRTVLDRYAELIADPAVLRGPGHEREIALRRDAVVAAAAQARVALRRERGR